MDVQTIRRDFPILQQRVNEEPLVYFDNAATSQLPLPVLDAMRNYYLTEHANVHRGVHTLAERATEHYERVRQQVADFINAQRTDEIVFTRSTTESLNVIARGFGDQVVQSGDEIVVTAMEHHSNLVPWQELASRTGAELKFIELDDEQKLDFQSAAKVITPRTKIVAITAASNVLGTVNPVQKIVALAHQMNAYVVVDAAQYIGHHPVNVQTWGADFIAFSGHKMLAPTGIGVLYGQHDRLAMTRPVQFGGEMIENVTREKTTFKTAPLGFEAGTPNIGGVVGLGAAIDYFTRVGWKTIEHREQRLTDYLLPRLREFSGVTLYGPQQFHTGVFAFNLNGLHPHDVATGLDMEGIAVRAGHHCAQPLMKTLGVTATVRASVAFYNTVDECQRLIDALAAVKEFFSNGLS
ncbi:aminotransferase class V-fold PLP-dependent enzyme [uncultured Limosilactobacillus sp.]|uniref:aminotransferase class V-fold PLP-dependent enzyme n=1 Tax=uncultured Limosilactobacillus sp. TaxID=2837629 RepID=UPI0025E031E2|nr:cysteine desulfurase [uncultured Limosilactobacillus sp.]